MLGTGQGKERARLLTLLGMCAGEVKVFANVSAGAVTQKQTLWGRGAPEAFDLRLREDFHELEQA